MTLVLTLAVFGIALAVWQRTRQRPLPNNSTSDTITDSIVHHIKNAEPKRRLS